MTLSVQVDKEIPKGRTVKDGELLCYQLHPTKFRIPSIDTAEDEERAREYVRRIRPVEMKVRRFPRPIIPLPAKGWGLNKFSGGDGVDAVRKMRPSPFMMEQIGGVINNLRLKLHFQPGPGVNFSVLCCFELSN